MSENQQDIEDLVDFYKRWPSLRGDISSLKAGSVVTPEQASIIRWMVFLTDRVGPADLEPDMEQ